MVESTWKSDLNKNKKIPWAKFTALDVQLFASGIVLMTQAASFCFLPSAFRNLNLIQKADSEIRFGALILMTDSAFGSRSRPPNADR